MAAAAAATAAAAQGAAAAAAGGGGRGSELEGEKRRREAHAKHVARHQRKRLTKTRRRECARHAAWSDDMDGDLSSF